MLGNFLQELVYEAPISFVRHEIWDEVSEKKEHLRSSLELWHQMSTLSRVWTV